MVQDPPTSAGKTDSFPGSGRALREGNGNPLQIPWAEEPGGLQPMTLQKKHNLGTKQQ